MKGCSGKIIDETTSGNVTVKTDDGVMCELNNIRIVPGLVMNIISTNQLRSEGWKIEEGDECEFNLKRNGQVLKFKRGNENNLYYIHANSIEVNTISHMEHAKIVEKAYDEAHDE